MPRATNFDESRWDRPSEFFPERFLGYDESAATYINITDPTQRDHWSYGAGRRVCPGVHLAEKSLYLNISRLLWGFNMMKKEVNGEVIEPNSGMVPGWLSIPAPFECDIRVRSEQHSKIITKEWESSKQTAMASAASFSVQ